MIRWAAVAATVATMGAANAAVAGPPQPGAEGKPRSPIEHFIVLMQENHSFDNYFGTYPGADGVPRGTCLPAGRSCVRPFHLGSRGIPDLAHDGRVQRMQYAGGRMDGFVRAASAGRQAVERSVMGYYDERDLPFYWNVADEYVLFDRFFASAAAGSVANHVAWVSGTPGRPADDMSTIFDRLESSGVSWKFYVEDFDPTRAFTPERGADRSAQAVRVPLLNLPRYVQSRRLFAHIVDLREYYEDLQHGSLPQVAYIVPAGASEHPPTRLKSGEELVRSLVTALMRSPAWSSSAFMWTYDEWGGWFDHVRPPRVGGARLGFRVPALLVSPYARRGHVDSTRLDTSSIPSFIQRNWGLRPLPRSEARAKTLERAFDFSRPPRRARLVPATRGLRRGREARRWVIYTGYGGALLFSGTIFGLALRRRDP